MTIMNTGKQQRTVYQMGDEDLDSTYDTNTDTEYNKNHLVLARKLVNHGYTFSHEMSGRV
jgi:hypothetical protein